MSQDDLLFADVLAFLDKWCLDYTVSFDDAPLDVVQGLRDRVQARMPAHADV